MSLIKRFVGAIVGSKKAVAATSGVLFALLAPVARRVGLDISQDQVLQVLGLLAVYIGGQSVADHGKEAAKIAAPVTSIKKPAVVK